MLLKLIHLLTTVVLIGRHGNNGTNGTNGTDGDGNGNQSGTHGGSTASIGDIQATTRQSLDDGTAAGGNSSNNGLPPGYYYGSDGRLRYGNRFAEHPNAGPRDYDRRQYPSGYRPSTHEDMVTRYTDEGREAGGWPTRPVTDSSGNPVTDSNGNPVTERIPREELTWRNSNNEQIPFYYTDRHGDQRVNVTYDHNPPVVEHWNTVGHNQDQQARDDYYNKTDDMTVESVEDNSSKGGRDENGKQQTYQQDVGDDYQPRPKPGGRP
ncbi:hypothetical protein [Stackebrandtia soli]|uniref:hypothetical protein n=1 Tax=Stackebrandtia soli TaxID=1892856 RepID=UPI0039EA8BBC